ncbi:hypothetical protein IP86_11650 [Rhodopseudomonas sp. AAP120]|nr:hypothetical protein IP86_11650 [Rhodopseudomonas sp. AAP120]
MMMSTAPLLTSPRLRGEVARRTQFDERVRGRLRAAELLRGLTDERLGSVDTPPHPSLLPARGEKEQAVRGNRV